MTFKREMGGEVRPRRGQHPSGGVFLAFRVLTAFMFGGGAGWGAEENVLKKTPNDAKFPRGIFIEY